ncbi:transmembrane protein 186 [Neosynchiropus ocellatus]
MTYTNDIASSSSGSKTTATVTCPLVFQISVFSALSNMIGTVLRPRLVSSFKSFSRGSCLPGWTSFEVQCKLSRLKTNYHLQSGCAAPQIQRLRCYTDLSTLKYNMIYTFPHIKLLRAISRMKLFQTGLTVVVLPPVYTLYLLGHVPLSLATYSTGGALFAGIMLYAASHFFRRVVGMMYLDPSQTTLKVSHLTFWGKRNDLYMPVTDVMPVADTGDSANEVILRLKRYSTADTLYFFSRYGRIVDKEAFERVLGSSR